MKGREVTFKIDKRREPVLLSEEESLKNTIIMALFLKQGQDPSRPEAGVDIRKYIYKTTDEIDSSRLLADLIATCGDQLVSTSIRNLAIASKTIGETYAMLIQIDLITNGQSKIMAIAMQKSFDKDRVHVNYRFVDRIENTQ